MNAARRHGDAQGHDAAADLFAGPGETRAICRAVDWAATPLGPVTSWPSSLRTAVDVCLGSALASFVWWGPELVQLYNDAAIAIIRAKHPALGLRARDAWADVWSEVGPLLERVVATGEAVRGDDLPMVPQRGGAEVTAWFTFSYGPVRDEQGVVAGVFCTAIETTERVRAVAALEAAAARDHFRVELTDALRSLDDPAEVHVVAARMLGEFLEATGAPYGERATDEASTIAGRARPRDWGDTLAAAMREGRTLVLPDVDRDAQLTVQERAALARDRIASLIAAPLAREDHRIAGFVVYDAAPRAWTEHEVALVKETLERTRVAMDHARAEVALRESEDRQAFLVRLSDALRPLSDPDEIERTATRMLGTHLDMDYVHFTHIGEKEAEIRCAYGRREPSFVGCQALSDWEHAVHLLRAGRPYVFDDIEAETLTQYESGVWSRYGVRSQATVPIVREGRLIATLAACSVEPHTWTERELEFVTETAERAWTAIERARAETDRESARTALASQTRFLDATLSSIPDFVYAFDRDRRFVYVNRAMAELFGRDLPPLGKTFAELRYPPELAERLSGYIDQIFRTGETVEDEVFYTSPVGMSAYFQFVWGPVRDEAGAVELVVGVSRDTTERRRLEERLRESEVRARTIAELAPAMLWEVDPVGDVIGMNTRWREYTGQRTERARSGGWLDAIHPDDRTRTWRAFTDALESGRSIEIEHRIRRQDGAVRWFLTRQLPVRDAQGRITRWLGAATDIHVQRTALDEAERIAAQRTVERDALRRQLGEAEEEERRRLARELHDQLGQHITAFSLGLADLRRLLRDDESPEVRLSQLEALTSLMTRDTRYLALELRPPELDDVGLESALDTYVRQWGERFGITAELAVTGAGAGRRMPGDVSSAIYRIVQEALTNVAKHARARQVSVVLDKPDGEVRLIVEDDGQGFDPEATAKRARIERRLGLASMRERAELVRGSLEIESSEGAGTAIYLRVPLLGAAS